MSDALLVVWIALLGADRVDLLGGIVPFAFTPFLALTPVVVLSELLRRHGLARPLSLPRPAIAYLVAALTLLSLVLVSVFVSTELSTSAARAALLLALVVGTFVVALAAHDRVHFARLLARGAVYGVLVFVAFDVVELFDFIAGAADTFRAGPLAIRLVPFTYGQFIPRLSGPVADPNRAGLLLLFYAFVIGRSGWSQGKRWSWIAVVLALILLTISRSAALAVIAAAAVALVERRDVRVPAFALFAGTLALAAATTFLLAAPAERSRLGVTLAPLVQRLSLAEGSATSHLTLVERGISEGTASVPRATTGLGFGNSYTVLQDVFPGNRYGNFHSLYVSMFAESGIFALLVTLVLLGVPLVRAGPWRGLVAGVAVFSIFYQAAAEPVFWTILALAWLTMQESRSTASTSPES